MILLSSSEDAKIDMKLIHIGRLILLVTICVQVLQTKAESPHDFSRDLQWQWNWGKDEDLNQAQTCHITPVDRIGDAGQEGEVNFRSLKPNVYQVGFTMPAFDFDLQDDGAIKHVFFLTFHFKDTANKPVSVYAGKGGCGFYGAGYVGCFGGAADGQWKEETVVIRRSMMRCLDGHSFRFALNNIKAPVPVASCTLWSAGSPVPDTATRVTRALQVEKEKRQAELAYLLPKFKNLGLPDPGHCADYTTTEKDRGFRVFFPPVNRWLFANSNPLPEELTDDVHINLCPGQSHSLLVAVRGLKDLGQVGVTLGNLKGVNRSVSLNDIPVRWAVYSPQRIGSSWGTDYRECMEQLVEMSSQTVATSRLEVACLTFQVPDDMPAGSYRGNVTVTSEKGGKFIAPVAVTIYPFHLEHPGHATHGQFYYASLLSPSPVELRDMRNHGMDTMVSEMLTSADKSDWEAIANGFKLFKRLGYRSPLISDTGGIEFLAKINAKLPLPPEDPAKRSKYIDVVRQELATAKAAGFEETAFFPVDEPHTDALIAQSKRSCAWIKEVPGARTFITSNPKAVPILTPVLDDVCYNLTYLNNLTVANVASNKQTLMFYCPSIDVNPELNRYRAGYYFAKLDAHSCYFFAYFEFSGDPFNDLDGDNRDWNVVYPSLTSVTHDPTLEWEAMREGVDDYRFVYTLQNLIQRARNKERGAAADNALLVLNGILSMVDLDGKSAGGPAMQIEADTRLKNTKLDSTKNATVTSDVAAAWYDQSRAKIASAIITLKQLAGE